MVFFGLFGGGPSSAAPSSPAKTQGKRRAVDTAAAQHKKNNTKRNHHHNAEPAIQPAPSQRSVVEALAKQYLGGAYDTKRIRKTTRKELAKAILSTGIESAIEELLKVMPECSSMREDAGAKEEKRDDVMPGSNGVQADTNDMQPGSNNVLSGSESRHMVICAPEELAAAKKSKLLTAAGASPDAFVKKCEKVSDDVQKLMNMLHGILSDEDFCFSDARILRDQVSRHLTRLANLEGDYKFKMKRRNRKLDGMFSDKSLPEALDAHSIQQLRARQDQLRQTLIHVQHMHSSLQAKFDNLVAVMDNVRDMSLSERVAMQYDHERLLTIENQGDEDSENNLSEKQLAVEEDSGGVEDGQRDPKPLENGSANLSQSAEPCHEAAEPFLPNGKDQQVSSGFGNSYTLN